MEPRWPEDGPKMEPRWSQDGAKNPPKLASRLGEVRILQSRLCTTIFRSHTPEIAQDGRKMTPRWPKMAPSLPQNGPKMVPRRPQGDPQIGVSCRRNANFANSAMLSQIRSPRRPKVALRRLKTAQDEPRWSQDGPRWPEDGLKMEPRWSQDGNKTGRGRISDVAELHFCLTGQNRQHWRLV